MKKPFADQVALVTGSGTGIGRATSLMLGREGAKVAVNYSKSRSDAEQTVDQLTAENAEGVALQADVSDDGEVRRLVDQVVERFGRLDILVNNAGVTQLVPYSELEDMTVDLWDRIMAVNARGTFLCSRAAIGAMRESGGGQIINVSSITAYTGQGSCIAYAGSKAAIVNITQALAFSQAPDIRVNCVAPGVVETRWIEGLEEFTEPHRQATPLQRLATPEDVAQTIYGLAINEYITGQTILVDGGRMLQH